tara:strand:+ start:45 stop:1385 length:1341 start_codon:yes stop_codon:yes gene_type:complete
MAVDKLSDVLKQEAEGIMFPFRNKVKPVSDTTQEAYNSTTDGIMSITGKKYIGPDSVIQYGDSYQRQLKQIEKGMLPQFDQQQFPDVGEGIVEDRGFPKAQPVDTTPVQPDEPKFDPCPPGFKLIDGVCRPIEQDRGDRDRPTFTGPEISKEGLIKGYVHALDRAEGAIGPLNSSKMLELEKTYGVEVASKIGEINQKYRQRGVQIKILDEDDPEIKRLQTVYGQDRVDKDYVFSNGKYYRIVATSPKAEELIQDAAIAAGDILKNANMINVVQNVLSNEEDKDAPSQETTPRDFGTLFGVDDFGQLQRNIDTANLEISAATEALQQIANSTKYREQRTDKQIDDDIRTQQRKIEKAKQTIEESNDMMQGTSAKEDRERAAIMARDINRPEEIARKAAQRAKESEARRKAEAAKPIEQRQSEKEERSANFRKLSKDIASFRDKFRR